MRVKRRRRVCGANRMVLVIILASVSKSCHDNCSSCNREYNKITKNNFCRLLDVFADELNYTAKVGCAVLSKMLVQMWMLSTFMLTKLNLSILCLSLLLSRLRGQVWSHLILFSLIFAPVVFIYSYGASHVWVVWPSGGLYEWHVRNRVWWCMGHQRCQCCLQTARLLRGYECLLRQSVWTGHRTHLARWGCLHWEWILHIRLRIYYRPARL